MAEPPAYSVQLALITLYHALNPGDIDITQLRGKPAQVDAMSKTPDVTLPALTGAVDLDVRQDRYVANLAYALAVRCTKQLDPDKFDLDAIALQAGALGQKVVGRLTTNNIENAEGSLRSAVNKLLGTPTMTEAVATDLVGAFGDALQYAMDATGNITFTGTAAETAAMLCELASSECACQFDTGTVMVNGVAKPVQKIVYDICTQAPWDRVMPGVDPQNWHHFNPLLFDNIDMLVQHPVANSPTDWTGAIQETVGTHIFGRAIITNLNVSYMQQDGLAVATYDLSTDPHLRADDNTVEVDYGYFSASDEGMHRRIRLLKVLHVTDIQASHWLCPLWAQQLGMIGWWFVL